MFFSNNIAWYYRIWPWVGFGAAIFMLVLLFATNYLRDNLNIERWYDPYWLAWLCTATYLLHNAEEYGIDLTGKRYSFPKSITSTLAQCGVNDILYVAVNIPLLWLLSPLAAYIGQKKHSKMMASFTVAIMLINIIPHTFSAIFYEQYNPGLLTALFLLIPISVWTYYINFIRINSNYRALSISITLGVIYHLFIFFSIQGLFRSGIASRSKCAFFIFIVSILYYFLVAESDKLIKPATLP